MKEFISPNDAALFGANDSETIQNAVEAACADGCRKIVIPRYNARTDKTEWCIGVSIKLPDDFTVILDNCYMVQETGYFENMFTNTCAYDKEKHDIKYEQKNIAILGVGNVVLDGGKHNRLREKTTRKFGTPEMHRNNMLFWVNVNGLRVENINIQHQRWWAINHIYCRNVTIKNVHFYAIPHVNNMDGIDLRVGCNNFLMENITGRTGDDVIALTGLNGRIENENRVAGKDVDIHDVKMRNVKGDPHTCFCVRLLNHDGVKEYNIDIDTIMDTSDFVSKIRPGSALGMGSPIYFKDQHMQPGDFYNITAKNITTRAANTFFYNYAFEHSKLSNIHVFGDGHHLFSPGVGGPFGGCHFDDLTIEHVFYGNVQYDMIGGKSLPAENFRGVVFGFVKSTGNVNIKDVHVDKAYRVFKIDGGVKVNVEGYECGEAYKKIDVAPDSTLIINGEVK